MKVDSIIMGGFHRY